MVWGRAPSPKYVARRSVVWWMISFLDTQREHARPGLRRLLFRRVDRVRQRGRHQVDQYGAQPGRVGGPVGAGISGELDQKLRQQHARPGSIRQVPADGPLDRAPRQGQQRLRDLHADARNRAVTGPDLIWTRRVVEVQIPRLVRVFVATPDP
jgi:hypothetical protein